MCVQIVFRVILCRYPYTLWTRVGNSSGSRSFYPHTCRLIDPSSFFLPSLLIQTFRSLSSLPLVTFIATGVGGATVWVAGGADRRRCGLQVSQIDCVTESSVSTAATDYSASPPPLPTHRHHLSPPTHRRDDADDHGTGSDLGSDDGTGSFYHYHHRLVLSMTSYYDYWDGSAAEGINFLQTNIHSL
ncbi:unnamed protein product [Lactuca virosa]|uniref:Uncharacterized protein n=1 Tax=Lactuca virosa TaxID=75947 RepID=A0AAU9NAE1_9ASTR|nr:unnamed protein product [Lactuca virosa]